MPTVLRWGRFDPDYSRNRILRALLPRLGWSIVDFHPHFSRLADVEARLRRLPRPDLVWVPCFRQRDLAAARRWSYARGIPLLFDPLISAYDKQVYERAKFSPESREAQRLHEWERRLFQAADIVLADTQPHAEYFAGEFGLDPARVKVVYVGAEEPLFHPAPMPDHSDGSPIEVLFYGSFIRLQAPQIIVEAARLYEGPPVQWTLLGKGPLREECERRAAGLSHVRFEDPLDYEALPARIHRADILLGVFDVGDKAGRVIPNKVFQSLACGRPVTTRNSAAYPARPEPLPGLSLVAPGNPAALAQRVSEYVRDGGRLVESGRQAYGTYARWFSNDRVSKMLSAALQTVSSPG